MAPSEAYIFGNNYLLPEWNIFNDSYVNSS